MPVRESCGSSAAVWSRTKPSLLVCGMSSRAPKSAPGAVLVDTKSNRKNHCSYGLEGRPIVARATLAIKINIQAIPGCGRPISHDKEKYNYS